MSRASITAVVLAGGRGSRLNGRDKGLVEVAGKALISHVIERIQPHVKEVIISANRNGDKYASKGYQVLPDEFEAGEYAGPLAGVLAGLDNCDTEFLLTVPCDTPCLPDNLVEQLSDKMNEDHEIVSVNDGERLQPVIMLMRCQLARDLRVWLEQGNRAARDWLMTRKHAVVTFENPQAFSNINTEEDLKTYAQEKCE